ncbi:MAG: hypothetical protein J4G14_14975 [Dehalococcoidia bacterium]|nr:hypothetical protein [Dehalococcoidia bacterium]
MKMLTLLTVCMLIAAACTIELSTPQGRPDYVKSVAMDRERAEGAHATPTALPMYPSVPHVEAVTRPEPTGRGGIIQSSAAIPQGESRVIPRAGLVLGPPDYEFMCKLEIPALPVDSIRKEIADGATSSEAPYDLSTITITDHNYVEYAQMFVGAVGAERDRAMDDGLRDELSDMITQLEDCMDRAQ